MTISKIIIGTVQMGLPYGINNIHGQISLIKSKEILKIAFRSGLNILDTAEAYGNAHNIIGDFHISNPQNKFKIITKFLPDCKINDITDKVEQYLTTLRISRLECLMFHSFESYKINLETFQKLEKLKKKKIINKIGVSIYTNEELKQVCKSELIDVIQLPFNLLDNYHQRGHLIAKAKSMGKEIHARSVFLQGLFFKPLAKLPKKLISLKPYLKNIHELCKEFNISVEQLALSYALQQNTIDYIIIGIDTLQQLKMNIKMSKYIISNDILEAVNKINVQEIKLLYPKNW
ncbi:MAG: aldo/keto reductase [bacterium]|nr:aldo/keto reductase [bacterium]